MGKGRQPVEHAPTPRFRRIAGATLPHTAILYQNGENERTCALARSLGNARAFPQPRDLTGSSPREGPET